MFLGIVVWPLLVTVANAMGFSPYSHDSQYRKRQAVTDPSGFLANRALFDPPMEIKRGPVTRRGHALGTKYAADDEEEDAESHHARLLRRATRHPIDMFFMQTRRRVSLAQKADLI
jgi:hypothetical protein